MNFTNTAHQNYQKYNIEANKKLQIRFFGAKRNMMHDALVDQQIIRIVFKTV